MGSGADIKSEEHSESASSGLLATTVIVHCVNGPVWACEGHAKQLVGLAAFMGYQAAVTVAGSGHKCSNCVNESR